jgi:energy-coupling factor transport system permease protein
VYRPEPWGIASSVVVVCALLAAAPFALPLPGFDRTSIFYYPYPRLIAPEFSVWLGMATWGLLAPAGWILFAAE